MSSAALGGAQIGIGFCNGELNTLVLSDRPAEDDAVLGIDHGLLDEPFGIADAFGADQDPLGIHAR